MANSCLKGKSRVFLFLFSGFFAVLLWSMNVMAAEQANPQNPASQPSVEKTIFKTAEKDVEKTIPTIIISPDAYYPLDNETLYIEGASSPNAVIGILIQKPGGTAFRSSIQADSTGDWVFAEKPKLGKGEWEIRVRSEYPDGSASRWSNVRIVKVVYNGFQVFGFTVKYGWLIAVLFLILFTAAVYFIKIIMAARAEREAAYSRPYELEEHLRHEEIQHEKLERTLEDKLREMRQEAAQKKADESATMIASKIEALQKDLESRKKAAEEEQKTVIPPFAPVIIDRTPEILQKQEEIKEEWKKELDLKMKEIEAAKELRKEIVAKGADEAKQLVAEGFTELRKDFQEQLKVIEERSKYQPLSPEEIARRNLLLDEISRIEKQIQGLKAAAESATVDLALLKTELEKQIKELDERGTGFKPLTPEEEAKKEHLAGELAVIEKQITDKIENVKDAA